MMLKDGIIIFEGTADELRASTDPYIQAFLRNRKELNMPRTRSLKWSELKIGIMAVVALLIAATLILALGGEGGFFWQQYNLKVKFPNAGGVQRGSPVRVAGVTVGAVTDIAVRRIRSRHAARTSRRHAGAVRTTSRATIGSVSLLGEGAVDINADHHGSADSRVGLCAVRRPYGADGRRHGPGEQGDHRAHRVDYGHPRR